MDYAVDYSAPPSPFQPRENKPAPSHKQHDAMVVAVNELEGFAFRDQNKSVDELQVLGKMKHVHKKYIINFVTIVQNVVEPSKHVHIFRNI